MGQRREAYDRSKDALEASIATFERSFDVAGWGAAAFNHKIIDIDRRNLNSGFDLANSLAGAKNLAEIVELQAAYWRKQFSALTAQAEEVPRFKPGGGRRWRAAQGAGENAAWMSCARRTERLAPRWKYARAGADLGPAFFRTMEMTVPHHVNEHQSDIRAIKPGWYRMESNGKLSSRAVSKPGEMPHRNHSAEKQFSSITLAAR